MTTSEYLLKHPQVAVVLESALKQSAAAGHNVVQAVENFRARFLQQFGVECPREHALKLFTSQKIKV